MIRIEAVAQNGIPTKKEPLILTDEPYINYWGTFKNAVSSLVMYEDLEKHKFRDRIATSFWNATIIFVSAKLKGALPDYERFAFAAYDEYKNFPVWVIVMDNYNGKSHIEYYDAQSIHDRDKFAWALKRKEN